MAKKYHWYFSSIEEEKIYDYCIFSWGSKKDPQEKKEEKKEKNKKPKEAK